MTMLPAPHQGEHARANIHKGLPAPHQGEHFKANIHKGLKRHLMAGGLAAVILVFGLGGMAATIDFAGAVTAGGRLVVDSSVKKVQHQEGGTVAEIDVKEGDRVKAGQVLLRLDPTAASANLAIITKGIDEGLARRARLEAERDGAETITFPPELLARADDPDVAKSIALEKSSFEVRRSAREGQREQLEKQIAELREQIVGLKAQEDATRQMIALTKDELGGLLTLKAKELVSIDRLASSQRQEAQLEGQLGQIVSNTGQVGAEIARAEVQILQVDQDMRSDVAKELSEVAGKLNELAQRKIAAQDQLAKLVIKSPQDGTVYQLGVHTIGGVVGAGEPIMMVVPENDKLVVEAKVDPGQVDRLHLQLPASLRFTTLGGRTTPEFEGVVENISPDVVVDQRTGAGYYTVRVTLPAEAVKEVHKLGVELVPGIPVEVFITTDKRTVLSYLVKPLADQVMHTFRER